MTLRKSKTTMSNPSKLDPKWFVLDAAGKTLGRFASQIAMILMGKHRPTFTTFADDGDGVIVINADKIKVTGAKSANKIYRRYTGAMGGMRETVYNTMMQKNPTYPIEHAVKGMVKRSRLGRQQMKRLRVFAGSEHNMQAQQPIVVNC